jgi:hypothetical protein
MAFLNIDLFIGRNRSDRNSANFNQSDRRFQALEIVDKADPKEAAPVCCNLPVKDLSQEDMKLGNGIKYLWWERFA